MPDTTFMESKFSIKSLVTHYLDDIKSLRNQVQNPSDETKLQTYYQAANTFKNVSIKDIIQLAISFRGNLTGKPAAMRNAFPQILARKITQASKLDIAYLHLLLEYANAFKAHRSNIKEWLLRFLLSSQFSPLYMFVETEINNVISDTEHKIATYQAQLQ